jgi:hypothetical protein
LVLPGRLQVIVNFAARLVEVEVITSCEKNNPVRPDNRRNIRVAPLYNRESAWPVTAIVNVLSNRNWPDCKLTSAGTGMRFNFILGSSAKVNEAARAKLTSMALTETRCISIILSKHTVSHSSFFVNGLTRSSGKSFYGCS